MSYHCNEKGGQCTFANCIGCCTISACVRSASITTTAKPPMTNADRIRAMTDEELAELLTDHSNNGGWVTETGREICYERITEWLQQPCGGAFLQLRRTEGN